MIALTANWKVLSLPSLVMKLKQLQPSGKPLNSHKTEYYVKSEDYMSSYRKSDVERKGGRRKRERKIKV